MVLLASDASSWLTGAIIPLDGGNLAMNAGGVRDFLKHRVNSLLANDAAEFAGFLRLLAWDAELRKRLGANGRRCAEAQSWTDVLKQLEHDYVGLASHKGKLCA